MSGWLENLGVGWLALAAILGIAELIAPGTFLVFLAVAAAITGVIVLLFPDMPLAVQVVGFAAWATVAVLLGRRFYRELPVESADPLLNARAARLVGETVVVTQAIEDGRGRVRVGDGEWPARGVDAAVGAKVRVTGADGASLRVEPIVLLEEPRS